MFGLNTARGSLSAEALCEGRKPVEPYEQVERGEYGIAG